MNNFSYWYNEIADMPTLVDGRWVDLETGIPFGGHQKQPKKEKPVPVLEINGKAATIAAGLEYAERLLDGQKYAMNKFSAYPQSEARDAYLVAGAAAIESLCKLNKKSKKAEIAAAIKLNQAASRAQNAIPR